MKQHPAVHYVRFLGMGIGVFLFVFMIYQSSKSASNPAYAGSYPRLAAKAPGSPVALGLENNMPGQAAQTTYVAPSNEVASNPNGNIPASHDDTLHVKQPKESLYSPKSIEAVDKTVSKVVLKQSAKLANPQ